MPKCCLCGADTEGFYSCGLPLCMACDEQAEQAQRATRESARRLNVARAPLEKAKVLIFPINVTMRKLNGLRSSAKLLITTIAAATLTSIPPTVAVGSQNPVAFAEILAPNMPGDFVVTDNGFTSDSFTVSEKQITFLFENITGLPAGLSGPQTATLTITATSTIPGSVNGGNLMETGYFGTFSIIDNTPVNGQTNLLSGTFRTGASVSGSNGANSATFSDSTTLGPTEVVFTSSFISFGTSMTEEFALSLNLLTSPLALGAGNFISSFAAVGDGVFESGPDPEVSPEPASIFSVGIGLLALAQFARNRIARNTRGR
jgi:hypothetical protein